MALVGTVVQRDLRRRGNVGLRELRLLQASAQRGLRSDAFDVTAAWRLLDLLGAQRAAGERARRRRVVQILIMSWGRFYGLGQIFFHAHDRTDSAGLPCTVKSVSPGPPAAGSESQRQISTP